MLPLDVLSLVLCFLVPVECLQLLPLLRPLKSFFISPLQLSEKLSNVGKERCVQSRNSIEMELFSVYLSFMSSTQSSFVTVTTFCANGCGAARV